ncbi:NADH-quinone oxidoreductase subunit NuoE [Colwellia sp. TT2012]|uniref:NADH-quinone oxidoreductase subunit NuoE n=1 Tax=Colwellia sp. TT2012 TaxID=1720342 RepID=UPI0007095E84|nr:NADH-quinone oxidoreductase subunit NuoE [Colwellia sp. TT2012]
MTLANEIPTNETVELSDVEKAQIDTLLLKTPYASGASIDALKIIQNHRGWVSDASLLALALYLNLPLADLDSVATFYNLIFRQPVGKVVLHPCDGISCDLMGGQKIRQCLNKQLKISNGQTTDDNQFTLIPLPCLGACDKAPVMIANETLFELIQAENLPLILNNLIEEKST